MKPRYIELNIDELVLHGFSPADRHLIGEAVQRELARMFAEQDLPSSLTVGNDIDHLDGGTFETSQNSRPEATGKQVAAGVYKGLRNPK